MDGGNGTLDINSPKAAVLNWRNEADDIEQRYLSRDDLTEKQEAIFHTRKNTLRECADMLNNRLIWSGMDHVD